jgi:hypothetical protein
MVIVFTEHLYTQIVTTSKYSAITDSQTLQLTTARTKPSQSAVFTSRCLVAAVNSGTSPYSRFPKYPGSSQASNSNSSQRPNCSNPLNNFTPLYSTQPNSLH